MITLARAALAGLWSMLALSVGLMLGAWVHPLPADLGDVLLRLPLSPQTLLQRSVMPTDLGSDVLPPELSNLPPADSVTPPALQSAIQSAPKVIDFNSLQPRQLIDENTAVNAAPSPESTGIKVMHLTPQGTLSDEEFLPKSGASGTVRVLPSQQR